LHTVTEISNFTDEELLALYKKKKDSQYFGYLYNRYIPLVYGLCLKYLQDATKAEDATMQLFEDLSSKISNYEVKIFRTWLYSVAKNHCFQILRKKDREVIVDSSDILFVESGTFEHLFNEDDGNEKYNALQRCLKNLPEPQRISITKFYMDELSYADIVDKTGYNLKSVKSYIQNGKRNLKICIEKNTA